MNLSSKDNRGRRSGIERRNFSYTVHVPERRSGKERREAIDREIDIHKNEDGD
jgi:hypothetical protein